MKALIPVALLSSFLLTSCGDRSRQACELDMNNEPVALLAGARSNSPIAQYAQLRSDPTFRQIEMAEDSSSLSGVPVERFDVRREVFGHPGRLEYVFYKNVLAQTRFHADPPAEFFESVKSRGLPGSVGSVMKLGMSNIGFSGSATFGASDARIAKALQECVYLND